MNIGAKTNKNSKNKFNARCIFSFFVPTKRNNPSYEENVIALLCYLKVGRRYKK